MITRLFCLAFSLVVTCQLSSQETYPGVDRMFGTADVVHLDSKAMLTAKKQNRSTFSITIPIDGRDRTLLLTENHLYGPDYMVVAAGDGGTIEYTDHQRPIATEGVVVGDPQSTVSLTINDGFIYGRIELTEGIYYIEPLSYYEAGRSSDSFVVYDVSTIKDDAPHTCGVTDAQRKKQDVVQQVQQQRSANMMGCFEVDWAIANDFQMFQSYGSVAAVENHAVGVANDVQTNYDDEFADEIQFFISEQFVATTSASDPWTSSNNAGTVLNSFTNWGPNGFTFNHDIGSLWTGRNFSGSTIGIAWLGVVCTGNRYNCLEDFSSNGNLKRVMVAHEIGHNFDAEHDNGSGFIMSPSVNNTTTWSNTTISEVESHYLTRNCLATCAGSGPSLPEADMDFFYITECASTLNGTFGQVDFVDLSTNSPTSWDWSFEGGDPSTSTQASPTIFYDNPGTFNVTLTVTNAAGSDTEVFTNVIDIAADPFADYVFTTAGLTATFTNISSFGVDYLWSFGDGMTSTLSDPSHTYASDGTYDVTLTVINGVCENTFTQSVTVMSVPQASITSDVVAGCVDFDVAYSAGSSVNAASYAWTFPGGTPTTSTISEPTVTYSVEGSYGVELIVTGVSGLSDTLEIADFITASTTPTAAFTTAVSGLDISLTNGSSGHTSTAWDFGDGSTSTVDNPSHTYAVPGDYSVVLSVTNQCGTTMAQEVVDIEVAPTAGISSSFLTGDVLCSPYTATFTAQEQNNLDTYEWTFDGGSPATSTDASPTVDYFTEGSYDVKLVVSNDIGSDSVTLVDYVVISGGPSSAFSSTIDLLTATFADQSIDADTYAWDFGDGTTSSAASPTHTYSTPGVYTVMLTVQNLCGSDVFTAQVSVESSPIAGFISDINTGCVPLTVAYTSTSSANTQTYLWTFEGGSPATSTDANPVVTYDIVGDYDVTLEVGNAVGNNMISKVDYVSTSDAPIAGIGATVVDNLINLEDNSLDADNSVFKVDGVVIAGTTYIAPQNGSYTLWIVSTNACGVDSTSTSVTVSAYPSAAIGGQFAAAGCAPLDVSFVSASTSGDTYLWTAVGATPSTSDLVDPTFTYSQSGVYELILEVSNAFGSSTTTEQVTVTITPLPTGDFDFTTNAATVSFVAQDVNANYSWDFGDGGTATGSTAQHTYTMSGVYDVVLSVTGVCGTIETTQEVTIEINTSVVSFDGDITDGCAPMTVDFMDFSSNDPTSWLWTFEGGTPSTSTDQNPSVTYASAGTYDVSLTVDNAFGPSTNVLVDYIIVRDVPVAAGSLGTNGSTVEAMHDVASMVSYRWEMGDGTILKDSTIRYTYDEPGAYDVMLIAENACGADTLSWEVSIVKTSTDDLEAIAVVEVYPNPATDRCTIHVSGIDGEVSLQMLNLQGQSITDIVLPAGMPYQMDISSVQTGTYILRLESAGKVSYRKLLIAR